MEVANTKDEVTAVASGEDLSDGLSSDTRSYPDTSKSPPLDRILVIRLPA